MDEPKKVELNKREQRPNVQMITMPEGVLIKNQHLPTSQYIALDEVDQDETIRLLCKRRGYSLPEGFGSPAPTPPATEPFPPPPAVVLGEEYVDLANLLHIDDFDLVVRAVEGVVNQSETLCLDDEEDRKALIARLQKALGTVVEKEDMRL